MKRKRSAPRGGRSLKGTGTMPNGAGTRRKKVTPQPPRAKTKNAYKAPPKPGSAEFNRLQRKWYDKLADDGFVDIERREDGTMNEYYLRFSFNGKIFPARAQFFRLLQNYVTHGLTKAKARRKDNFILRCYNEGMHARQIVKAMASRKFKQPNSLYWLHYHLQTLVEKMIAWNKTHPEGLLNAANADRWADDCLLADMGLDLGNGVLIAQGWWAENVGEWWDSSH